LLRILVLPIEPATEIIQIKYFTAPVLARFASDPKAEQRQAHYHRALKANNIEIIKGFHLSGITTGHLIDEIPEAPHIEKLKVEVMEEKQTDVNIGVHMYRDCVRTDELKQIILCSNDSDLEPALEMIKNDFPDIKLGLVLPRKAENHGARRAERLEKHVNWTRHAIHEQELADSQLSDHMLDRKNRTIKKPDEW